MRYLRENVKESFSSWGRHEMMIALIGYIILALVSFLPASLFGGNLATTIFAALGLAAVLWFFVLVLIVTPARMWYAAQQEIASLRAQFQLVDGRVSGIPISFAGAHIENVYLGRQDQTAVLDKTAIPTEKPHIYIAQVKREGQFIRDQTFEDCEIHGPAVIFPTASDFVHCAFEGDPDAILWEMPPRQKQILGAVGVERCQFRRCVFVDIGIVGYRDLIRKFRKSFGMDK